MVRRHHSVDRYGPGKSTESDGQEKTMEKDEPWCGQPSHQLEDDSCRSPSLRRRDQNNVFPLNRD